jgi:hypothetical protein
MTSRAIALAAVAFIGLVASAQALECPERQPMSKPGVIQETPSQIAALAPALAGGDVSAEIPAIVAGLRKRYPGAGSAEIANYLITAYCPGVQKAAGLSDAEKSARVEAFAKAVLGVLY